MNTLKLGELNFYDEEEQEYNFYMDKVQDLEMN